METFTCKCLFVTLLFCILASCSFSQTCNVSSGIASNNCTTPGSIPLTEGANVNTGQEYSFTGTATFGSVNVNGGRLRICGNLTLINLNFNGGEIIVEPSGTLNYAGSATTVSAPNQLITNYGTLIVVSNYTLTNNSYLVNYGTMDVGIPFNTAAPLVPSSPDAFLVNQPNAFINVPGLNLNLNSTFINRGISDFGSVTINSSGAICMGQGSILIASSLVNNALHSVSVESGNACMSYNGAAQFNQELSNASNLLICRIAGSQDPAPAGFGPVTVVSPCSSCLAALPVSLQSFTISPQRDNYLLKWITATEDDVHSFVIESSDDGQNFHRIGEVAANNRPSVYTFSTNVFGKTFFRIKILDLNGSYTYSKIVFIEPVVKNTELVISPNPARANNITVVVASSSDQVGQLVIIDMTGRIIRQQSLRLSKGVSTKTLALALLPAGVYQMNLITNGNQKTTQKLVIQRE